MEQQVIYSKTCPECDQPFTTHISLAVYCGTCNAVAQVLYILYMTLSQRWNVIPLKPNPIVERVLNVGIKPIRKLTNNG